MVSSTQPKRRSPGSWPILIGLGLLLMTSACVPVHEYQKMYLNDRDMALEARKAESYELSLEGYREGAAGATSGKKSGGGCGCN
jgi:hypothetical protein